MFVAGVISIGVPAWVVHHSMQYIILYIEELETPVDIEMLLVTSAVTSYFVLLVKRKLTLALLKTETS